VKILDGDATDPKLSIDASSGAADTDVKITAENSPYDFTKASAVAVDVKLAKFASEERELSLCHPPDA
jgi:hypothetical protein